MPDERFLSLEQLFKVISPSEIILIFDTNIVIDFRDFYFNAKTFSTNPKFQGTYFSVRYLVEQIERYDLELGAQFALEESSRSLRDFKLNYPKAQQTNNALKNLFSMNIEKFDKHIEQNLTEQQIIATEDFPDSKIECLKTESTFQDLLILSYIAALKMYDLMMTIEKNQMTHLQAMLQFITFLDEEINVFGAAFIGYAFNIFGGYSELKPLIFSTEKKNKNKRLHKIFNGAIDLVFPNIADKSQSMYMGPQYNSNLIPVFVTRDKYISILHSILNTVEKFDDSAVDHKTIVKVASYKYIYKTVWKPNEIEILEHRLHEINLKRELKAIHGPRSAIHLIEKIKSFEDNAKRHF